MKKWLVLFLAAMLLTACGGEKTSEEKPKTDVKKEEVKKEPVKQEASEQEGKSEETTMTEDKAKELIENAGMGEGDELEKVSVQDGEIRATVKLGENEYLGSKDFAVTRYSQASDEFLKHEGWDVLTIEYTDIGTISMNRSQKDSNEAGDFFPTAEIERNLK